MNFNKVFKVVVSLSLASPGAVGAAQAVAGETATSELESIVIKEDQQLQTGTLIRGDRVEQIQAEDIKESLKGVSEVLVGGGQKNAQKVYVRGVEDTQMNVTVDGARQSGYLFHHQGRLSVDTELMKQIEVDAGTGNALAGPGALGGSLRFETKDPEDLLLPGQNYGAFVKARYATNADEKGASLGLFAKPVQSLSFLLYGNFSDSGNYHAGGGDAVNYTAGKPQSGLGKVVFTPGENQKLSLTANFREDNARRSLRNHFGDLPFNPPNDQEFESQSYTLQHSYSPGGLVNLRSEFYVTETQMSQETETSRGEALAKSFGGQVSNKVALSRRTSLTVGTDYNVDRSEGRRAAAEESETGRVFGLFAQGLHRPGDAWTLTGGLRYDNYDFEDAGSQKMNFNHLSPNVRVGYQITPVWSTHASWAQAYKGATPMEAYVMSGVKSVAAVNDLKGTTAETSELGLTAQWSGLTVGAVAYHTVMHDTIQVSTNRTTGLMTRSNAADDLVFKGINLTAHYQSEEWSVRGGYSHNKSEFGDEPLGYTAFNKGTSFGDRFTLGADYKWTRYNVLFSWDSLVALELTDVPSGALGQPGYDVHDLSASWVPDERLRLGLPPCGVRGLRLRSSVLDTTALFRSMGPELFYLFAEA